MAENKDPFVPPDDLRQRAEAKTREDEARIPTELSAAAARQLLHELRVHELELELQNEELRRIQGELEASRARYFDLYDLAPVGYFTLSEPGLILEANLTGAQLLGVSRGALLQVPLSRFIHPDDEDQYYLHRRRLFTTGTPQQCEVRLRRSATAPRWARLESTVARDPEVPLVCRTVLSDITERKRLEQELIQTQRLRAISELSAGVCHNLNNLLTSVMLPAEMLLVRSDSPPQVIELAQTILSAGTRATDLVHRLNLSVRRSGTETLGPIALAQAIEAAVEMTQPRWKDGPEARGTTIEVHTDLAEIPPIKGTEFGLHDLLVNLLLNAADAMPVGGTITIATKHEGEFVQLSVTDTGIGMSEETRLRVFEPFFTTKADIGTGLGLSTLHNTLVQWGGSVAVASAPGKGSTFTLRLPVWKGVAGPPSTPPARASARPGRVLVIDDDPDIGNILRQALRAAHQVEVFADGVEALEQCRAGSFDVAIVDLGMPAMAGDEVCRRLAILDPAIGRILFTGWELEADDPRRETVDFVLQKPLRGLQTRLLQCRYRAQNGTFSPGSGQRLPYPLVRTIPASSIFGFVKAPV